MNINPATATLSEARNYLVRLIGDFAPNYALMPSGYDTPSLIYPLANHAQDFSYCAWGGDTIAGSVSEAGGCWLTYRTGHAYHTGPGFGGAESNLTGHHDTDLRIIAHLTEIQQILTKAGA